MAKYGMSGGKPRKGKKPAMGKMPKEKKGGMTQPHAGHHTGHNAGFHDSEMDHEMPEQSEGCCDMSQGQKPGPSGEVDHGMDEEDGEE